jgi:hypothetical protein
MRKAIIGALGLITVIVLLCITSCQGGVDNATQEKKPKIIHLRPGRKLVSCDWNSYSRGVWYITRDMKAGEEATEYEYGSKRGILYIIKEEARRDMSGQGHRGMDMESIRQMRMEE